MRILDEEPTPVVDESRRPSEGALVAGECDIVQVRISRVKADEQSGTGIDVIGLVVNRDAIA